MTTKTTISITCDYCKADIDAEKQYVNASTYGRDFHIECVEQMDGGQLITLLDLDIKVMKEGDWDDATKAPMFFRNRRKIKINSTYGKQSGEFIDEHGRVNH